MWIYNEYDEKGFLDIQNDDCYLKIYNDLLIQDKYYDKVLEWLINISENNKMNMFNRAPNIQLDRNLFLINKEEKVYFYRDGFKYLVPVDFLIKLILLVKQYFEY